MSLFRNFIELITTQPGALVYHLVILFAIQLIVGVAIGHWRRRGDEAAARLLVMGIGLFLARGVLMLIGVFDLVGLISSAAVFPPLERFLHLLTTLFVIWAFLPIFQRKPQLSTWLVLLVALLASGTYAVFAARWPEAEAQGIPYTGYWQEGVWELSTAVILESALVASLIWRGADWGWLACLLAVWLTGHLLQLVSPVMDGHTAGWIRLANLAALPLLAGLVFRRALEAATFHETEDEEPLSHELSILEAAQRIETDGDLKSGLAAAAPAIARAVDADVIAIGLLVPGPVEALRIVALHPTTSVMAAQQEPTLLLSKRPLLTVACREQRTERASLERVRALRLEGLYQRLGFEGSGPLLVQPLSVGQRLLGLVLVGTMNSERAWSSRDEQIVQASARVLAQAIVEHDGRELPSEEELAEVREEAQRFADRAKDLEAELSRERRRGEVLSTQLRLREREIADQEDDAAALTIWQEEVRELAEAREALQVQLAQSQEKAERLRHAKTTLEQQLKETRSGTASSTDGHFGGFLVSDDQGTIVVTSRSAPRFLETPHDDLITVPVQSLFEDPAWTTVVEKLLQEDSQPGDTATVSLSRGERMIRAELTRLPLNQNWPGRLMALFYLAKGTSVQDTMVGSLIQELRTPMTSITGYTDLLLGEKLGILGESQRRLLLRVEANIERMERLLDDLIKATDIDIGQMALVPQPVAMDDIIEKALETLSARFDEKDLRVELEVPSDLPPAHADPDSAHQIVLNLLSNAALSSEPGTKVRVAARVEGEPEELEELPPYLVISVTDTGGGVAPEDRRRVFRRFYRADTPLIPGIGDKGVGLSVAKALVEANDGRIWVESEMGSGSTFGFMLPISRPDAASGAAHG